LRSQTNVDCLVELALQIRFDHVDLFERIARRTATHLMTFALLRSFAVTIKI
jgi:hypothetical protein